MYERCVLRCLFQHLRNGHKFNDRKDEYKPPGRPAEKDERDECEYRGTDEPRPVANDWVFQWRGHTIYRQRGG